MAAPMGAGLYSPKPEFVGMTLKQAGERADARVDQLSVVLGIPESTILTAEMTQPFFGEHMFTEVNRIFNQTSSTAGAEKTLAQGKPIVEAAYAERGKQLESSKQPMIDRYNNIIDELKGREERETTKTSTATATEYGKRGIPLSSGMYEEALGQKTSDISRYYGTQIKDVGFEREEKLKSINDMLAMLPIERAQDLHNIDVKIAEMKAAGAERQLTLALEAFKIQREEKWRQQEFDLQKQKFELERERGMIDIQSAKADLDLKNVFRSLSSLESQFGGIGF